jgi:hypothetical protein
MLYRLFVRRERRLALYVPHAVITLLFASFVRWGIGFVWRYTGDFWPAIVLACVQYAHTLPAVPMRSSHVRMTKIMFWYGVCAYLCFLVPWCWSPVPELVLASDTSAMWDRFRASRWGTDQPLPSKLSCGDRPAPIFQNGLGWKQGCTVDTFTNALLGVVPKDGDHYRIRATTEGMAASPLQIYVNGTIYTAQKIGDSYEADVSIRYAALISPVVVVTVQWTRDFEPPPGRLLSLELV